MGNKDLVIFDNDLNKLNLSNLSKVSYDIFIVLLFYLKNKNSNEVIIPFNELRKKADYPKGKTNKDFANDLMGMQKQLLSINSKVILKDETGDKEVVMFNIFKSLGISEEKKYLRVSVNEDYAWLLNDFKRYTAIELYYSLKFSKKVTKNLYRVLMQWRSVAKYSVRNENDYNSLLRDIGIPESFITGKNKRNTINKYILPAIDEIKEICDDIDNITCTPLYSEKQGGPVIGISFEWSYNENRVDIKELPNKEYKEYLDYLKEKLDIFGLSEDDYRQIIAAIFENDLDKKDVQDRIEYTLEIKDSIKNIVGYLITIMHKFSNPIEVNAKVTPHLSFPQRQYDYEELERRLLNRRK